MEELLKEILKEQQKTNRLLKTIRIRKDNCCLCGDLYLTDALFELSDGKFVCETCAMIQGELADD
ncbi:hypothetical protein [Melissococcus plutonius]|uniref:hypothetical protein n=1 Tax=Melissococcus plutonius TaxID=33970 RepID=UPI0021E594BC|nr:hypothetical protein [Melissococcus plutonius]MCV2499506.1 hypothetical protein [Melissococcus plutonius]MCV2505842.1 hypothetical protein [Melissococcus plutonius]MCV2508263.1 hypothetical protein [Melissococcus plutonius]MCV2520669.1 hypothetical protein [Melissococcus plutonius]MCV2527944.1 hypothetical protein [Melissococcus plutonius]